MKTTSKAAIVAVMTTAIGFTAIAPTFAQDAAPIQVQQQKFRHHEQGPRNGGPGGDILGFERGAEAVEIALVRLSHRLELTAEQQPLFDTFKTDALKAANDFATTTEGLRPTPQAEGEEPAVPNFVDRLDKTISLQAARLAALEAVQPSATAFFESLTEDQLAGLRPQRPEGDRGPGGLGQHGPRHQGEHGDRRGPGAPGEAPSDAPAPPPANG
ncbi:LTXXQ motif family protein [Devosia sp. YR412]|uniref:Spy/CpxP family protein refolding chaperone n=1 Tax=Devosia sp. YR412 TaxID=1881030 RepID=UPI0008CFF29C|nr:Spy/CpxP family protein refolding chaperone [Devosia sp. YR412]SEQ02511.1 LTXXQ motif family protein [Devosia sp. YR412]